ncbi:MAG: sigma-70 family RNA polymerase sigma factor [Burkholderiaceae bacterium]|nr:sigma-70 family RNA polymerase sigma factor [Burkholderiaceae bacterium]
MNATSSVHTRLRSPPQRAKLGDAESPDPLEALFDDPADHPTPELQHQPPAGCKPCADDAQLTAWMAQIAERDERALSALYDATLSRVYGLVLRIVRRPAWAEEVVEDTYFQVWRQALRFDASRGRALTWLLGMARSRAIDALRRESRFDHDTLDDDEAPALVDTGLRGLDEVLDLSQGQATLQRALLALGAQPRQLVALAFLRGLSHEEIAARTELPLGTVKSQIRRALISLRELLNEPGAQALSA